MWQWPTKYNIFTKIMAIKLTTREQCGIISEPVLQLWKKNYRSEKSAKE